MIFFSRLRSLLTTVLINVQYKCHAVCGGQIFKCLKIASRKKCQSKAVDLKEIVGERSAYFHKLYLNVNSKSAYCLVTRNQ